MLFSVSHNQNFTLKALLCKRKLFFMQSYNGILFLIIFKFSGSGLLKKQKAAHCISIQHTNKIIIIRKLYHRRMFCF